MTPEFQVKDLRPDRLHSPLDGSRSSASCFWREPLLAGVWGHLRQRRAQEDFVEQTSTVSVEFIHDLTEGLLVLPKLTSAAK